ncbi:hypothetical protein MRX96_044044 [Rhipicephalus microplus]
MKSGHRKSGMDEVDSSHGTKKQKMIKSYVVKEKMEMDETEMLETAHDKETEKGETSPPTRTPRDMPHEEKSLKPRLRRRLLSEAKSPKLETKAISRRRLWSLPWTEAEDKIVESHIAPWEKHEGEEDRGADKVTATTQFLQPTVKEKAGEKPVKGRPKRSKKEHFHDVEKSDVMARSPEKKKPRKVFKMATTEAEMSTTSSGKEIASKKSEQGSRWQKKKNQREKTTWKKARSHLFPRSTAHRTLEARRRAARSGKKKHKKKSERPERTAKKTEVETGTTDQIALEHEQKYRTSVVEQVDDEHPVARDKVAETVSELPVPKRSIMKGVSDSRRRSKQHNPTGEKSPFQCRLWIGGPVYK